MKIKNINVHFTEAEIDKKIRELGARISEDWPSMVPLTDNILLKVVSEIHDRRRSESRNSDWLYGRYRV